MRFATRLPEYYLGLDVHSKQSVFVIEDSEGAVHAEGAIPSTPAGFQELQERYHLPAGTPVDSRRGRWHFSRRANCSASA